MEPTYSNKGSERTVPALPRKFMEFAGVRFPPLPHGCHRTSLKSQIKRVIADDTLLPIDLCLSWGLVLALYTNTSDVLFGLLDDRGGDNKSIDCLVPWHLTLQSEDVVRTGLQKLEQYQNTSHHFEKLGLDSLRTTSLEAADICDVRNVLVIRPLEGLDQAVSVLRREIGSNYPFALICGIGERNLGIHALFDSAVICREQADSVLHQFAYTVGQVARNKDTRLADIQSSNPEDLAKNIQWNTGKAMERSNECVYDLVQRHSQERPFSPAVCAWDGEFTYGELDKQAACIAEQLCTLNVGPGQLVFILSEKSKWAPVGILGTLKAGGAFALLDPSQPTQRLITLCDLASPQVILASAQCFDKAALLGPRVAIIQDVARGGLRRAPMTPLSQTPCTVEAHHMLYVSFTSGSTGTPKGVIMEHGAFTSFAMNLGLTRHSRVFQSTSYQFGACVWEHLTALTQGACLCIPSDSQLENDTEGSIRHFGATWAMLTPSVARLLEPANVPSLGTVYLVGEAGGRLEASKWAKHAILYLAYGQSECCGHIIAKRVSGMDDALSSGDLDAGAGWIVDARDHNRLMPLGAEGELLLQGPCLARGYINSTAQTNATFISNPAWAKDVQIDQSTRFLKTGDIFTRDPVDGSFQFRGRKGRKVKIRSQRIELSEVEYHLQQQFADAHLVVAEVVCPSNCDSESSGMLVAIILVSSPHDNAEANPTPGSWQLVPPNHAFQCRAQKALVQLSKVLPTYMIPSSFIPIVDFPRTASGKVHRKLLVEMISKLTRRDILAYLSTPRGYRAPSTKKEAIIHAVCAMVLSERLDQVGMDDSFLSVGGDSLSARQMVALARREGLSITVADCLKQPNLAALANCAHPYKFPLSDQEASPRSALLKNDFLRSTPDSLTADMIEDVVEVREMQLVLAQSRIMDYLLIRISGSLDPIQLRRACENLVRSHTILRTIIAPFRSQHVQVILRDIEVPWMGLTEPTPGQDPDLWAHSCCAQDRKTSPSRDEPSVKFLLLQDDHTQHHTLIMRMSHAQSDGLCLETILGGLAKLYEGQPLSIKSSYGDYVRKCAELRTDSSLQFWRDLLAGSTLTNILLTPSTDHPNEVCIVATQRVNIPLSPPAGSTWATVVKAAWSYVLQQKTRTKDITFCQMVNCRYVDVPEPERIMGPCLNPVPVRVQFRASWTVKDLLHAVQSQHLDSLEYQTMQWNDIVANCTDWEKDAEMDSIVLHENINLTPQRRVGDAVWQVSSHSVDNPPERTVYLYTYPEEHCLHAVVILSSRMGSKADAESLIQGFCSVVTSFTNCPDTFLSSL